MMNFRNFWMVGAMVAVSFLVLVYFYPQLPMQVPLHWGLSGEVDGYGPNWVLFLIGPGLMAAEVVLFASLPRISPQQYGFDAFEPTYLRLTQLTVALSGYLFAVLLATAIGVKFQVLPAVLTGISVFILLMGNMLEKVQRNFFIGIRTPWTLASTRVWNLTHRFARKSLVVTGLLAGALALFDRNPLLWLAAVLAGVLAPVLYSLVCYKKLERRGQLNDIS
jgi:hypothetical protein